MNSKPFAIALLLAAVASGCMSPAGTPKAADLQTRDGRPKTVVLLRAITDVEGRIAPPFEALSPPDNLAIGCGGFSSGGNIKPVTLRFLSAETRKEGWTYLLLEPGFYYLSALPPISGNALAYDAQWKTSPRWSIEIPPGARIFYAGTFYLPGKGRWMLFRSRQLAAFDTNRIEVRDETSQAEQIVRQNCPELLPMSVQLAKAHQPGDTMILRTPIGK
jgi:hypothetical protein